MILMKNDEVIEFLTWPPTDFSALKMFKLRRTTWGVLRRSLTKCLFIYVCIYLFNIMWQGTTSNSNTSQHWTQNYCCRCGSFITRNNDSDLQTHLRSLVFVPFDGPYMISSKKRQNVQTVA